MRTELISALARRIRTAPEARAFLTEAGFPMDRAPVFDQPRLYWTAVAQALEDGVMVDGTESVLRTAVRWFPGADDLAKLLAELTAAAEPQRGRRQRDERAALDANAPCSALLLVQSDQHAEFLAVVRRLVDPEAELLYATREQSAVRIADPGDRASEVLARVEAEVGRWGGNTQVTYARYDFRPYLFGNIVVFGPDGAPYELRGVPATTLVRDIPFAVLSQYDDELVQDSRGRYVQTVVDHIGSDGEARRLDPDQTLHEANFQEGDSMRVSAQATAGRADWFQESVETARAQITRFAEKHPEFTIVKTNHPELPTSFDIEIAVPGFAPPEDLDADPPRPVRIDLHRVYIGLTSGFPRQPPVVFWESEVFHPNIVREPRGSMNLKGAVCLGALMDAYRPDLDLGELCEMLIKMACYRNYEARDLDTASDSEGYVDPEAARWARSPEGQEMIRAIGGSPLPEAADAPVDPRPPRPLWIEAWGAADEAR
jgi:hypothetical protein